MAKKRGRSLEEMTRKELNKLLDDAWSEAVKREAGHKCEVCGKEKGEVILQSHHIFKRGRFNTRWDVQNGICLCKGQHKFNKDLCAHDECPEGAARWRGWIRNRVGAWVYDELYIRSKQTYRETTAQKIQRLEYLKRFEAKLEEIS